MAEHIDLTAIHRAPARDHAVPGGLFRFHAEVNAAMGDEHVELFERPLVQQKLDPLARRQLALGVLGIHPALPSALTGDSAALFQLVQNVFHGRPPQNRWHHIDEARGNKGQIGKFA